MSKELISQKLRKLSPEVDPLRIGTGWKPEDLDRVQVFIESTFGDSHPGSGHLDLLVKLLGCGVESAVARRTTNRGLGFDVATHLPTTYTHRKVTKAGVGRVVETCAAVFAANLISSSHFCKVLSGLTCCSRCKGTAVLCQVVTQQ